MPTRTALQRVRRCCQFRVSRLVPAWLPGAPCRVGLSGPHLGVSAAGRGGAALISYTAGFGSGSYPARRISLVEKPTVLHTGHHNTADCDYSNRDADPGT
jgi:hypothetical protein